MRTARILLAVGTATLVACSSADKGDGEEDPVPVDPGATFFVTSDTHPTGDLGGLEGADSRCATRASAAGLGASTWRAYLSTEDGPVHARDRIGAGPWTNVEGVEVAANVDDLHARTGDAGVFLTELGEQVNGQWASSPSPNEHDILTGSAADGAALAGKTSADWTSADAALDAQVGHSDGLGPGENGDPPFDS